MQSGTTINISLIDSTFCELYARIYLWIAIWVLYHLKKNTYICNLCFCRAISQREEENVIEEFADLG